MKKFFVLVFLLFLSSCSYYSFVGQGSGVVGNIKSIYIDEISNETSQPNLQIYLKKDLIDTLNLDSKVQLVKRRDKADGFLNVIITNYDVEPVSYSEGGLALRYRCSISVSVTLTSSNGVKLIDSQRVSAFRDYSASDKVSATEKARNIVSKDVLKDIASKIRDLLFTGF